MNNMKLPERFTGTIYVMADTDPTSVCYGWLSFFNTDISEHCDDRILVGQVEVDIPLDTKGTTDKQIAKLRKTKQQIIDKATDQAKQIDEAIESLLAIEHTEEA